MKLKLASKCKNIEHLFRKEEVNLEQFLYIVLHLFFLYLSAYVPDENPAQVLQRSAGFCKTSVTWDYRGNQVRPPYYVG